MSRNQSNVATQSAVDDHKRPKRNWRKTAVFSLLGIAVVGAAGVVSDASWRLATLLGLG